uniref:uncharacterized protein isoform X3 n=1 Tax=Myxine glutinosa TaxID=7769 RepID=UPI00358FBD41
MSATRRRQTEARIPDMDGQRQGEGSSVLVSTSKRRRSNPARAHSGAATYRTSFKTTWTSEWPFITRGSTSYHYRCSICRVERSCGHQGRRDIDRHVNSEGHANKADVRYNKNIQNTFKTEPQVDSMIPLGGKQMDSALHQDFDPCSPEALQTKPHLIGSLIDKVALITGASSGIGACTAELMTQLGAKLALTGRNATALENVARRCQQVADKKPLVVVADLCQEGELEKLMEQVLKHYGKLDVLVNNAGILEVGSIQETSLEQLDRVMNINVRSAYQLTHLAVPHLITTQGCIVNVSSVNGQRSFPGVLAYCMSKAAIDQFTRCTALELASKKVRVNAVCSWNIAARLMRLADQARFWRSLRQSPSSPPTQLHSLPGRRCPWMADGMPCVHDDHDKHPWLKIFF